MSRDFHFAHQGFSNFVCKMYVQFNKREAPFLRVPHTCSGWRNCERQVLEPDSDAAGDPLEEAEVFENLHQQPEAKI